MLNEEELTKEVDERLKEHFYHLKEKFDFIKGEASSLAADSQKYIKEAEDSANKPLESKEYSQELRSLINDDIDSMHTRLLDEISEALSYMSRKNQNIPYMWIGILIIFALQIIVFLK
ncbi:MAG: hypothetical protein LBJ88_04240 [Campylobacteraceae bacterium]|jgi:hypothetical protein|nr:hypothetical protein [Campylobacteraceae bacterium]